MNVDADERPLSTLPLKQGLKQNARRFSSHDTGLASLYTSIKTRIETLLSPVCPSVFVRPLSTLPLKQGLKLPRRPMARAMRNETSLYTSIKTRIETGANGQGCKKDHDPLSTLPLKQGLKPIFTRAGNRRCCPLSTLPLKQGLKLLRYSALVHLLNSLSLHFH